MSPFTKIVILDNDCVSNLFLAESLELVLSLWAYKVFVVSEGVITEAGNWPKYGDNVCRILNELRDKNIIEVLTVDDGSEEEVNALMLLRLKKPFLGLGESESIAIAKNRDFIVATDDQLATERCQVLFDSIEVVTTGDILKMAVADGLLEKSKVNEMWRLIREKRSKRSFKN